MGRKRGRPKKKKQPESLKHERDKGTEAVVTVLFDGAKWLYARLTKKEVEPQKPIEPIRPQGRAGLPPFLRNEGET